MPRKNGSLGERGKIKASTVRLTPKLWKQLNLIAQCGGWSRAAAIENLLWTVIPGGTSGHSDDIDIKKEPPLEKPAAAEWYPNTSYQPGEWI